VQKLPLGAGPSLSVTQCLLVYSAVQPALQAQAVEALLAFGAIEFFGHFWHTSEVAPTFVEY